MQLVIQHEIPVWPMGLSFMIQEPKLNKVLTDSIDIGLSFFA